MALACPARLFVCLLVCLLDCPTETDKKARLSPRIHKPLLLSPVLLHHTDTQTVFLFITLFCVFVCFLLPFLSAYSSSSLPHPYILHPTSYILHPRLLIHLQCTSSSRAHATTRLPASTSLCPSHSWTLTRARPQSVGHLLPLPLFSLPLGVCFFFLLCLYPDRLFVFFTYSIYRRVSHHPYPGSRPSQPRKIRQTGPLYLVQAW